MAHSSLLRGALTLFTLSLFQSPLPAAAQSGGDDSSDPCASAASQQAASLEDFTPAAPGDTVLASIDAETAFNCVSSIPFEAADAATVISIIKEYAAFHTTTAYLKDPPESYQQAGVDLMGGLDRLAADVESGVYESQYDFDLALNSLFARAHEGHLNVGTGVFGLFMWRLVETIVAVSSDGQELPQVYAFSDVRNDVPDASPIVEIEGESVFTYIQKYANTSTALGLIDPHADWNQIMWNAPLQFGRRASDQSGTTFQVAAFQATNVYNGPSVSGRFANGSDFEWLYQAGTPVDLAANEWTSTRAIYNQVVLNSQLGVQSESKGVKSKMSLHNDNDMEAQLLPGVPRSSVNTIQGRQLPEAPEPLSAVPFPNYPQDPIVTQEFFGVGGSVSGYILADDSVGVLSLPSFQSGTGDVGSSVSYSDAVADFITAAKDAGVQKVVIDLSGNGGGTIFQGFDTAKRFFPDLEPSLGFRTRAGPQLNVIGSYLTAVLRDQGSSLGDAFFDDTLTSFGTSIPFSAALSLTTGGESWESWTEFFGPKDIKGDEFTNTAQYNLSSPAMFRALDQDIAGFNTNQLTYEQPWPAEDIVILHDGSCGSTCTIFSEILKTDAGVKSVVVGGIPQYGPMQGVAGTRGSNVARWRGISDISEEIRSILNEAELSSQAVDLLNTALQDFTLDDIDSLPTPLSSSPWRLDGNLNILDEIRSSAPEDPLQFVYQASDCRVFYTGAMIRDITELWKTAAKFAEGDDSVCVPGSTNGLGVDSEDVVLEGTDFSAGTVWASANSTDLPDGSDRDSGNDSGNGGEDDDNDGDGDDDSGAAVLSASMSLSVIIAMLLLW